MAEGQEVPKQEPLEPNNKPRSLTEAKARVIASLQMSGHLDSSTNPTPFTNPDLHSTANDMDIEEAAYNAARELVGWFDNDTIQKLFGEARLKHPQFTSDDNGTEVTWNDIENIIRTGDPDDYPTSILEFALADLVSQSVVADVDPELANAGGYGIRFAIDEISVALQNNSLEQLPKNVRVLGRGEDVTAFLYETPSESLVIKKYHEVEGSSIKLDQYAAALRLVKGVRGLEQISRAFPERGVVVTKYEAGKDLNHIALEEAEQIPREHIQYLAQTMVEMHKKGLVTDPNDKNFIYNPETGFAIIDFLRDEDAQAPQSLAQKLTSFIRALEYSPTFSLKDKFFDLTPSEFSTFANRVTALEQKWAGFLLDKFGNDQEIAQALTNLSSSLSTHTEYAIRDQAERNES